MIDKVIARLLMVSFFLPMNWQPLIIVVASAYFIAGSARELKSTPKSNLLWALFLGSSYLLYVAAIPFTPQAFRDVVEKICEYRLSYLLLPMLFAVISKQKLAVIRNELIYFVYAAIAACIATNIAFVAKYALQPGGFKGVTHVTYRIAFENISDCHPTYMTMYLVFATGILLTCSTRLNRTIKYILLYTLPALMLPLLAKSPLIALVLIGFHQAWIRRKTLVRYKWIFIGMLALMVASYLFVPFIGQRIHEMTGGGKGNLTDNSINVRKMIWGVDTTLLRHYWINGCGPGRIMHLLDVRYFFYSLQNGYNIGKYDPHNQYFYEWIAFGLTGIVLFLSVLITHLVSAIRRSDYLYLYLLAILLTTFFTESVLNTQHGIIFYSFFTALFFFTGKRRREI